MKIPFNYLTNQFKNINPYIRKWKILAKSTEFTLGPFVENFEKKFAKFIGAKYCISTNNGTDALILCLKALGVKRKDEVITVCNSFYASAGAIAACGAKPILIDCDERYQININKIEKSITKKTKAIMPVHWGGASPEMDKIIKIAKKHKIKVIEDACMGIGAKIKGKSPGTFGIANAFSMHPLKSLNVMGDGGMVTTDNEKIYKWLKRYRNHGMINRDKIDFWGVNNRLQPFQAIVASEELKKIKRIIKKRNDNAKLMDKLLKPLYPNVIVPKRLKGYKETFALYMCLFKKRDSLMKYLKKNKIETKIHYPIPLNKQKAVKGLRLSQANYKIANLQAKKLLTLPIHQYLGNKEINYIAQKIINFYN